MNDVTSITDNIFNTIEFNPIPSKLLDKTETDPEPEPPPNIISMNHTSWTDKYTISIINKIYKEKFNKTLLPSQLLESPYAKIQADNGANRSVTNLKYLLTDIHKIKDHFICGIGGGITCTHKGVYNLISDDGTIIKVPMFYSPNANETIISPTDICLHPDNNFSTWIQVSHVLNTDGYLRFIPSFGFHSHTVSLQMINKLFYLKSPLSNPVITKAIEEDYINTITGTALYNLWHHRLGHPGSLVMENQHLHTKGIPSLKIKNPFFKCATCLKTKHTRKKKGYNPLPERVTKPCDRFHIDYGFVRKSQTKEENKIIRSREGYTSYLFLLSTNTLDTCGYS